MSVKKISQRPRGRPAYKYKPGYDRHGKKVAPPAKTPEEIAAKKLDLLEKRHNINPQLVVAMIHKQRGLLRQICRSLKVPRTTLQRYIDKHDECFEAKEQAKAAMGDLAESKLFEAIEAGDTRCILFYLSTVHRHRGYAIRPDNDAGERGPVFVDTVNIVGIPSGTFLPKPNGDGSKVIDH